MRWLVWHIYLNNPNIRNFDKPKSPDKILSLSIDSKEEVNVEANKEWGKRVKEKLKNKLNGR